MTYAKHYNKKETPQNVPTPGKNQVKNNAGGFVYKLSNWDRLQRFLIMGSSGGTYYVGERKLTVDNANCVVDCLKEDGRRVVDMIVEISDAGRAAKNEPALFALALAASADDAATRKYALENLAKVARIGTHLFQFAHFVDSQRGWGRGLRDAISSWYLNMDADKLAYQVIKYPQRTAEEGNKLSSWSHRDLLRKVRPANVKGDHNKIFNYVTKGWESVPSRTSKNLNIIKGTEKVKRAKSAADVASLIEEYSLPQEVVPKEYAGDKLVLSAMLKNMPLTATMRNLGRLTSRDVLVPMGDETKMVIDRLTNEDYIRKSRIHPINVLSALKTYSSGRGYKGDMSWRPIQPVVDALDLMLYSSFSNVEPTGKKILIALDISGSMWSPCMGMNLIQNIEASAVMSMATARSEKNYHIVGFTSGGWSCNPVNSKNSYYNISSGLTDIPISPRQRLDSVIKIMRKQNMGRTDCSLPMLYAIDKGLDIDAFVVYTDNETWAGSIKPDQALNKYRNQFNPNAKLIVCGTATTEFTIGDPDDAGTLNVAGFDSSCPALISDFIRG